MKKVVLPILVFAVLSLISVDVSAQDDAIRSSIDKIFKLCKDKQFEPAAKMIAYSGSDAERNYKSVYDYSNKSEKSKVDRNCKKIKAFLDISDSYEVGKAAANEKMGPDFYTVKVSFKSGSQTLNTNFSFVKINGSFALAEIE